MPSGSLIESNAASCSGDISARARRTGLNERLTATFPVLEVPSVANEIRSVCLQSHRNGPASIGPEARCRSNVVDTRHPGIEVAFVVVLTERL